MNLALSTEAWALLSHRWPSAPDHRYYLRPDHPHNFRFDVELSVAVDEVFYDERQVELHDLRANLAQAIRAIGAPGEFSCEGMARFVCEYLENEYPAWVVSVGVYEEGRTGARVST